MFRNVQAIFFIATILLSGLAVGEQNSSNKNEPVLWSEHVKITRGDFQEELDTVPVDLRDEFLSSPQRVTKLVEAALITKTLAYEARQIGLDKKPDVERAMEHAAEKVLAQSRLKALTQSETPDFEMRAKEVYEAFPARYATPEQASASHILIATKQRSQEDALKKALEVRGMIESGKLTFEEAATQFSDDPTAKKNKGNLGFFAKGRMVKPFEEAVFSMKNENEISEPILSSFGYHIIKFQGKKEAVTQSFESVKKELVKETKDKYEGEVRKVHLSRILNDPTLKMDKEKLLSLRNNVDWDAVILNMKENKESSNKEKSEAAQ